MFDFEKLDSFSHADIRQHDIKADTLIFIPFFDFQLASDEHVIKMEIGERNILVITNRSITQVPMAACSLYVECKECESARDPYCILSDDQTCASVFALK